MNRITLLVIVLTTLWAADHAANQFAAPNSDKGKYNGQNSYQPLPLPQIAPDIRDKLQQLYVQYDSSEPQDAVPTTTARIDETAQHGAMQEMFAEGNRLQLKAVVQDNDQRYGDAYALIAVTNPDSRQSEVIKYRHGDSVFGFQLTLVNNTQVQLSKSKQRVTLLMYKNRTKPSQRTK